MEKYISKDALVAEIERKQKEEVSYCENGSFASWADENYYLTLESIKSFLDTLEVKEVDLDKEADNYWGTLTSDVRNSIYFNDFYKIAKHFFELGIFSHLTWQDIRLISEIGEDFMNSDESDNLSEEEYYTAILNKLKKKGRNYETNGQRIRNLTQKGE